MSIILGFGATETDYRKSIENKVYSIVEEVLKKSDDNYQFITDEEKDEIKNRLEAIAKEYRYASESYKEGGEKPERYSYFYVTVAIDARYVFVGVSYSHINSQHPMSPDGMAMMKIKESYRYDRTEM